MLTESVGGPCPLGRRCVDAEGSFGGATHADATCLRVPQKQLDEGIHHFSTVDILRHGRKQASEFVPARGEDRQESAFLVVDGVETVAHRLRHRTEEPGGLLPMLHVDLLASSFQEGIQGVRHGATVAVVVGIQRHPVERVFDVSANVDVAIRRGMVDGQVHHRFERRFPVYHLSDEGDQLLLRQGVEPG